MADGDDLYAVTFVCNVEVPAEGVLEDVNDPNSKRLHGEEAAFAIAYEQITDDEADEVRFSKEN